MLLATFHLWNASTISLHLKCGMLTSTLLDVAAITCLKPTGETFDTNNTSSYLHVSFSRATFKVYIEDQHILDCKEVTDEKHIAFLTFWLLMYENGCCLQGFTC